MAAHSSLPPGSLRRGSASPGSHRRRHHTPRHVREEHRVARTAAAGAAGAVVIGAAFGLTGGGGFGAAGTDPGGGSPAQASLDQALAQRAEQAASRGLARAAELPAGSVVLSRGQAPQVLEQGSVGAPLPDVPESCEEYSGNRQIGCTLLLEAGFDLSEMAALDALWTKESGWNEQAYNASSGAYGIPQALPGSKMGAVADDWETNPATQIRWGLGYIQDRYGTPTAAWEHSQANGWY